MKLLNHKIQWDDSLIILRVWTGILFIYTGKSFFDHASIEHFADLLSQMKIPYPLFSAYLSKGTEFIGGILLCIGLFTQPVCLLHIVNMAIATFIAKKGDIFESGQTPFLLLLIVLTIFLSKKFLSLDNLIFKEITKG